MVEELGGVLADNANVMRKALEKTFKETKMPELPEG